MTNFLLLLGRILMSALFLVSSFWHMTNWEEALAKTAATGVWRPDFVLSTATLILALGGLSLLFGYKTRVGAALLVIEVLGTAVLFYPFWQPQSDAFLVLLHFLTRTALAGGLLILLVTGAGVFSLDRN